MPGRAEITDATTGQFRSFRRLVSVLAYPSMGHLGDYRKRDLQLVFYFYGATPGFYGSYAVIGLQDGEFALAVEFVGICGHAQGEGDWLFNSVKI